MGAFYLMEILVRLFAQGLAFFIGPDNLWNLFDVALIGSAVEEHISALKGDDATTNMSYLRVFRLVKTLKLLRVIRVLKAFRELRMVISSLLGSMKSMFWTIVLITSMTFMFGLCFVQGFTEFVGANSTWAEMFLAEGIDPMLAKEQWGSVLGSMRTLYVAITGGNDWDALAQPMLMISTWYYLLFCLYIGFFMFVVMNSLTSLFVDATLAYSQKDEDSMVRELMRNKKTYMRKAASFFNSLEKANHGELTYKEFRQNLKDPQLLAFASTLDVELLDLEQFFMILSAQGKRPVDLETFVVGCIKLKGMAKAMDMMDVLLTVRKNNELIHSIQEHVEDLCGRTEEKKTHVTGPVAFG